MKRTVKAEKFSRGRQFCYTPFFGFSLWIAGTALDCVFTRNGVLSLVGFLTAFVWSRNAPLSRRWWTLWDIPDPRYLRPEESKMSVKYRFADCDSPWKIDEHVRSQVRKKFPKFGEALPDRALLNKIGAAMKAFHKDDKPFQLDPVIQEAYDRVYGDGCSQKFYSNDLDPQHTMATEPVWVVRDDQFLVTVLTPVEFQANVTKALNLRDRLREGRLESDREGILKDLLACGLDPEDAEETLKTWESQRRQAVALPCDSTPPNLSLGEKKDTDEPKVEEDPTECPVCASHQIANVDGHWECSGCKALWTEETLEKQRFICWHCGKPHAVYNHETCRFTCESCAYTRHRNDPTPTQVAPVQEVVSGFNGCPACDNPGTLVFDPDSSPTMQYRCDDCGETWYTPALVETLENWAATHERKIVCPECDPSIDLPSLTASYPDTYTCSSCQKTFILGTKVDDLRNVVEVDPDTAVNLRQLGRRLDHTWPDVANTALRRTVERLKQDKPELFSSLNLDDVFD